MAARPDGHGGKEASEYVAKHLPKILHETLLEWHKTELTTDGIWNALKLTFVKINYNFQNYYHYIDPLIAKNVGTTATVVMMVDGHVWTANVGDSRTILDNYGKPFQLSRDEKPGDPICQRLIANRSGSAFIDRHNEFRIHNMLSVGKSIGDATLKQANSARPSITCMALSDIENESHIALVSDGITARKTTKELVELLHIHRKQPLIAVAKGIALKVHHDINSHDNLTVMIIRIAKT